MHAHVQRLFGPVGDALAPPRHAPVRIDARVDGEASPWTRWEALTLGSCDSDWRACSGRFSWPGRRGSDKRAGRSRVTARERAISKPKQESKQTYRQSTSTDSLRRPSRRMKCEIEAAFCTHGVARESAIH